MTVAPPPKKLQTGRLLMVLIVLVGICAGIYLLATR